MVERTRSGVLSTRADDVPSRWCPRTSYYTRIVWRKNSASEPQIGSGPAPGLPWRTSPSCSIQSCFTFTACVQKLLKTVHSRSDLHWYHKIPVWHGLARVAVLLSACTHPTNLLLSEAGFMSSRLTASATTNDHESTSWQPSRNTGKPVPHFHHFVAPVLPVPPCRSLLEDLCLKLLLVNNSNT
jgi:hypothetical protein